MAPQRSYYGSYWEFSPEVRPLSTIQSFARVQQPDTEDQDSPFYNTSNYIGGATAAVTEHLKRNIDCWFDRGRVKTNQQTLPKIKWTIYCIFGMPVRLGTSLPSENAGIYWLRADSMTIAPTKSVGKNRPDGGSSSVTTDLITVAPTSLWKDIHRWAHIPLSHWERYLTISVSRSINFSGKISSIRFKSLPSLQRYHLW